MTDMALIVPSRGRPWNVVRLVDQLKKLRSEVDLYIGVDADDPAINEYIIQFEDDDDNPNVHLIKNQIRRKFGPTLNRIAKGIADKYKYIAWMGDDHFPITPGWDFIYREELDKLGKVGMVYGDDRIMGKTIATQMAFTSNVVKALGYAVPNGFTHLFIDNYFMRLFDSIDKMKYLPNVIVEHLHYISHKSEEDKTYKEANSQENWNNDQRRFNEYVSNELEVDSRKLKKLL